MIAIEAFWLLGWTTGTTQVSADDFVMSAVIAHQQPGGPIAYVVVSRSPGGGGTVR